MVLGVFCAPMAGAAASFLRTPKYTAVAMIQIAATEQREFPRLCGPDRARAVLRFTRARSKCAHQRTGAGRRVRKADVAKLEVIQREQREGDPVTWLAKTLRVDCPPNTEILRVSLTTEDAEEAAALVNAVVDAYMNEVVLKEKSERIDRLNELERLYTEKETEMRSKRTALRRLPSKWAPATPVPWRSSSKSPCSSSPRSGAKQDGSTASCGVP